VNWILDHFQFVIAVAAALAAWLNDRRKKAAGESGSGEDGEPASTVTGEDDQTRRIQEEIRRKIAERRGQEAPAPAAAEGPSEAWHQPTPPVIAPRPIAQELPPVLRDIFAKRIEDVRQREEAASRARARAEQEQLRQREEQEAAAREREVGLLRQMQVQRDAEASVAGAASVARAAWRRQLRDPQSVRQAVVLREVLGTPVGLR
jgi:hypothetical protein